MGRGRARAALHSALLGVTLFGCGGGRTSAREVRPAATRAVAVVGFRAAGATDLFAFPEVTTLTWSHAAWIPVPAAATFTMTAYTLAPTTRLPVLFLARRTSDVPHFDISTVRVNSGPARAGLEPPPPPDPRPVPGWCEEESWLGGFFLEGIGPEPDQPVVVEYRLDGSVHRLLVEPARATVRGDAALSVGDETLTGADTDPDARTVHVEVAAQRADIVPLLVGIRTGQSVYAANGAVGGARSFNLGGLTNDPIREWRLYFLNAIAGSPPPTPDPEACPER